MVTMQCNGEWRQPATGASAVRILRICTLCPVNSSNGSGPASTFPMIVPVASDSLEVSAKYVRRMKPSGQFHDSTSLTERRD